VVAATNCGIAVHPKGGAWSYAQLPRGFPADRVTAVAASETRVWARDGQYNLVVSDANAQSFAYGTQKQHPVVQVGATGDAGTLAAFDSLVAMVCLGQTVPSGGQNYTRLIIYDGTRDAWIDQPQITYLAPDSMGNPVPSAALNGNGSFAIGRRFAKAYVVGREARWGADRQLFISNAQEVFRATGRNDDGTFPFERVVGTASSLGGSYLPNWQGTLHRDLWDFHLAPDGQAAWAASDGGIAETVMDGHGWHTRYHSLNTHHVQSLYVPFDELHTAYATQDNDAWIRTKPGTDWSSPGGVGDGNFVAGDRGNSTAVLEVRTVALAVLTGFGTKLPTSKQTQVYGIVLNNDQSFPQSPSAFRFIQTRKGEQFSNPLDAVMLTKLPFSWVDSAGASHTIIDNGQPFALIRNQNFEANPDVNVGQGNGWTLAADNLPAKPLGFCVSGAKIGPGPHTAPLFYLLAAPTGKAALYRSDGAVPTTGWTLVPGQPGDIVSNGSANRNGPVYVNPYDADVVYILTASGVFASVNATSSNATFQKDVDLSSLVSGNGTYPFIAGFPGGNATNVDQAIHNGGSPTETLSDMSFDHDDPSHVAAASPFTGAFANLGTGWLDLGQYLPKPLSPVISVHLLGRRLWVGTLGRGVLMLDKIDEATEKRSRPRPPPS
jgi:hypothetical protein